MGWSGKHYLQKAESGFCVEHEDGKADETWLEMIFGKTLLVPKWMRLNGESINGFGDDKGFGVFFGSCFEWSLSIYTKYYLQNW